MALLLAAVPTAPASSLSPPLLRAAVRPRAPPPRLEDEPPFELPKFGFPKLPKFDLPELPKLETPKIELPFGLGDLLKEEEEPVAEEEPVVAERRVEPPQPAPPVPPVPVAPVAPVEPVAPVAPVAPGEPAQSAAPVAPVAASEAGEGYRNDLFAPYSEMELAEQEAKANALSRKWKKREEENAYQATIRSGFGPAPEIINGRTAMFFFVVGLVTEYYTGQSMPQQVYTMLQTLGIAD